ncbi:hypothetical protein [Bacillus thuringiensis]|uniref:hypothetical protein n=1 Tax=Bacillus thuringiensis TaxID=1428 RepID=UPI000BF5D955|nr:hypothetical protein [Bacillus thuringiensis]PFJ08898.1 hypothetical protein COI87_24870 [Bacillus thuringiensis]
MEDLLYIHLNVPKNKEIIEQFLLLQAKVTNNKKKIENQKELFTTWSKITFMVTNDGGTIDALPKESHNGARYLIINKEIENLPIND